MKRHSTNFFQLSVCPHEIQNFENLVADILILGQFHTYYEIRGEKYLNTFIVTNANDCFNLLSYGATFRMGICFQLPRGKCSEERQCAKFQKNEWRQTGNGTSHGMQNGISYVNTRNGTVSGTPGGMSNVFQILNDMWIKQRAVQCQYDSCMVPTAPEMETPFRTTTPSAPAMTAMTAKQVDSVHVHTLPVQNTSWSGPPAHFAHVHKPPKTGTQTRRLISLEKSQAPIQWKDFCEQTPIDEARHSVTLFQLL